MCRSRPRYSQGTADRSITTRLKRRGRNAARCIQNATIVLIGNRYSEKYAILDKYVFTANGDLCMRRLHGRHETCACQQCAQQRMGSQFVAIA